VNKFFGCEIRDKATLLAPGGKAARPRRIGLEAASIRDAVAARASLVRNRPPRSAPPLMRYPGSGVPISEADACKPMLDDCTQDEVSPVPRFICHDRQEGESKAGGL